MDLFAYREECEPLTSGDDVQAQSFCFVNHHGNAEFMEDPALHASYVDDLHPQYRNNPRMRARVDQLYESRPSFPRYHTIVCPGEAHLRWEITRRSTARWERVARKLIAGRACSRWEHVVTRLLRLAFLRRTWGHVGMYLGEVRKRGEEAMREMGEEPVTKRKGKSKSRSSRGNR